MDSKEVKMIKKRWGSVFVFEQEMGRVVWSCSEDRNFKENTK